MNDSSAVVQQRDTLSQMIAVEIVTLMSATGTSFEVLAQKLNKTIEETRELVYGFGDEMTIVQLYDIGNAMNVNFKIVALSHRRKPHLKLVE